MPETPSRQHDADADGKRCGWCLDRSHVTAQCPGVREWLLGAPRSESSPDVDLSALADRALRWRTCKNALLGWIADQGLSVPASILELDPDYTYRDVEAA